MVTETSGWNPDRRPVSAPASVPEPDQGALHILVQGNQQARAGELRMVDRLVFRGAQDQRGLRGGGIRLQGGQVELMRSP